METVIKSIENSSNNFEKTNSVTDLLNELSLTIIDLLGEEGFVEKANLGQIRKIKDNLNKFILGNDTFNEEQYGELKDQIGEILGVSNETRIAIKSITSDLDKILLN